MGTSVGDAVFIVAGVFLCGLAGWGLTSCAELPLALQAHRDALERAFAATGIAGFCLILRGLKGGRYV